MFKNKGQVVLNTEIKKTVDSIVEFVTFSVAQAIFRVTD